MSDPGPEIPLALYVHMPWCVRKCPYCDFNSHPLSANAPPSGYIDVLIHDFDTELPLIEGRGLESVFFGGGTPSLFRPDELARLLEALKRRIRLAEGAEITLEANPGTIERGRFAGYREAGINRVSLGAQSFAAPSLERLGRIHRPEDTFRAVEELRTAGIDNFNLDLMYALPEQTLAEALHDVRTACELEPTHISHYQLTLEPGTVFHARPPPLPDEDAVFMMQTECQRVLGAYGFEQYEVSAYARAGARCTHNLNYWLFGDYVGVGAGAHGKLTMAVPDHILRTEKPRSPRDYQERAKTPTVSEGYASLGERRRVKPSELPFEFMLNALRLDEGFAMPDFERRTGLSSSVLEPALGKAAARGLLVSTARGWRTTELGRRFLNDVQAGFLE